VTTYGALAAALGSRSAARWVGEFMLDHRHRRDCPCHRVVRSTGALGLSFRGNEQTKVRHLQEESVKIDGGLVDLARFGFDDFDSDKPLERLIELQLQMAKTVSLPPFRETPETVAGVDVSYPARTRAVAAYAEVETATGMLLWSTTLHRQITFPHIPGLLAFRELPVLWELLVRVEAEHRTADLVFVDGNGLLHPRRAGIATCLGVMTDTVTIGVSKKLLLGSVDLNGMAASDSRAVTHNGHLLGMAIKAKESSCPIYSFTGTAHQHRGRGPHDLLAHSRTPLAGTAVPGRCDQSPARPATGRCRLNTSPAFRWFVSQTTAEAGNLWERKPDGHSVVHGPKRLEAAHELSSALQVICSARGVGADLREIGACRARLDGPSRRGLRRAPRRGFRVPVSARDQAASCFRRTRRFRPAAGCK